MVTPSLSRRVFLESSLATSAAVAVGCKPSSGPEPPKDVDHRPKTFTTRARIKPGQRGALHERIKGHQFRHAAHGIHFARLVIEEPDHLIFSIIYDGKKSHALAFLSANGEALDLLWETCEGYIPGTASDPKALAEWVRRTELEELLLYFAYTQTEVEVRRALALRDTFQTFLRDRDTRPGGRAEAFRDLLAHWKDKLAPSGESDPIAQAARQLVTPPSQTLPFTMITKLEPKRAWGFKEEMKMGEWAIENLHIHPLKGMTTLHYARFVVLPGDRLLFASVYDGDWTQYLDDFGTRIPTKLDKAWGSSEGYPAGGAADIPGLTKFLDAHKLGADAFFGAYLDRTVKQINSSLELLVAWKQLVQHAPTSDTDIAQSVQVFLADNQLLLG